MNKELKVDLFNIYDVVVFEDENGITQDCVCVIRKDAYKIVGESVDVIECNTHKISIYDNGNYKVCEKDGKNKQYYATNKKIIHLYTLKNDNRFYEVYHTSDYENIDNVEHSEVLDTDCVVKKTYISTHEYGEEDNRRYCYGLFDNFKDEVLEKCKICEAYINNAVLLKKVDNINYTEVLERFDRMFGLEEASDDYSIIKQVLIQAKKDKIIADFIREHYKLSNDINKNYLELKKPITEEEHIKFKENL
jgi:hypothetical protein